jgi:nicotinamide N-methyltransferase
MGTILRLALGGVGSLARRYALSRLCAISALQRFTVPSLIPIHTFTFTLPAPSEVSFLRASVLPGADHSSAAPTFSFPYINDPFLNAHSLSAFLTERLMVSAYVFYVHVQ